MLKKTIKYTDYNGVEREEDFYFNLTKAELTEMELSHEGGLSNVLEEVVASQNMEQIISIFKDLILRAYGEKSEDGRRFIKTPELSLAFSQTEAYSEFFMELASNSEAAIAFVNGILPASLEKLKADDLSKMIKA